MTLTNYGHNAISLDNTVVANGALKRVPVNLSLIDTATTDLPNATAGAGWIKAWISGGQYLGECYFSWTTAAVVSIDRASVVEGSAIAPVFLGSSVAGSLCIYDNGTAVRIYNRTGSTLVILGELVYQ